MYQTYNYNLIKTLFFVSIHLYINVDRMIYWTEHDKYDDQKQFLTRDLYNCFPNEDQHISLSILDLLKTMDICMKKTSYCLRTEDSNNGYVNKHHSERGKHIYCRLIAIDWKLPRFSSTLTHFTVHKGYLMHFKILLFDFEWSHFPCDTNGLIIMKSTTTDELCFCGKRIPWIMIFKTRDLEMKIITILPYKLTIFYSIHNINWIYAFSQTVYFHLKDYYLVFLQLLILTQKITSIILEFTRWVILYFLYSSIMQGQIWLFTMGPEFYLNVCMKWNQMHTLHRDFLLSYI